MKKYKKNTKRYLGTLAIFAFVPLSVAIPTVLSVSCANTEIDEYKDPDAQKTHHSTDNKFKNDLGLKLQGSFTFQAYKSDTDHTIVTKRKKYIDVFKHYDGTVVSISDGDTYTLKKDSDGQLIKIRCWGIDTPESTNPIFKVKPIEQKYSDMDTAHAATLLPVGSKVRVFPLGTSYDRIVAMTFYGENYEKSYGFQMLKDGFTLPRLGADDFNNWKLDYGDENKSSIKSLFMEDFAHATNYGIANKLGFYRDFNNPQDLQKTVYLTHGDILATELVLPAFLKGLPTDANNNIFKYIKSETKTKNKE